LTTQTTKAAGTATALGKLQSALSTFNSALSTLSAKKGVTQNSATLSNAAFGSATATPSAQPGSYSFFVEQTATASQVAFADLPAVAVALGGPVVVQLADGSTISLNLVDADADSNGSISQSEIARAVNQSSENGGKVTASVLTVGSTSQLVLTAGQSGAAGAITLDVSGLPGDTTTNALKNALSQPKALVVAQDAVVWLGAKDTGIRLQQAGNTFTPTTGVSVTFSQAMSSGATPLTLSVAADATGTAANVKSFVDAYNALESVLDTLTSTGDAESDVAAAAFASDSGIRALRNRLTSTMRQSFGGLSLMNFGVAASRDGTLSLDSAKLAKAVAAHPDTLSGVFGSSAKGSSSGLLGAFANYLEVWTNSASGQIKNRQNSVQKAQTSLTSSQSRLDDRYNSMYARYLKQFTALQTLQSQMEQNTSIFDSLASST
jgi:flagellar hook-associated protein 2